MAEATVTLRDGATLPQDPPIPAATLPEEHQVEVEETEKPAKKSLPAKMTPGVRYELEDSTGRPVGIQWWSALERMRFAELLGAENAGNAMFMGVAMPAFLCCDVAGKKFPRRPFNRAELEARIQIMGDDVIDVIGNAIQETMAPKPFGDETLKNS